MQFSIAIPVFGQAGFLRSALESIRVQAHDVQLAVMDATPDDSVQNILENYRDLTGYRRHGPDAGQASAIQEGWDSTDGEIVAWLCADDYFFPDTLDAVRSIFIARPDVDVVYGDSVFVNETGHFLGYFPEINRNISSILKGCCISQPSCFVRRTAFEAIGGRLKPELHFIMDWDLWTQLYRSGAKFQYLNKPLSVVRMYEGTKTSSRSWRRFFEIGRHLLLNTNPVNTVRSLIGFYHQNLLSNTLIWPERYLLNGLNYYRQKRQSQTSRRLDRPFNFGLSPPDNAVAQQAQVYLPWYNPLPPAKVWVRCDLQSAPDVHLNGLQLFVKPGTQFCYEIPNLDLSSHLLHLQLSSSNDKIWHLKTVEFQ